MDLKIFDVEHGACALLTCDDNARMMLDAGHNASTRWYPGDYLLNQGIRKLEMLTITNYDEDHVSGLENLSDKIDISWLSRNRGVETKHIRHLKSDTGIGNGMTRLCHLIDNVFIGDTATAPGFQGLKRSIFWHSYPTFEDENNLSLVALLECHGIGVLFTGDLEKDGWMEMLKRADFRDALAKTHILIAPHHGREGGCCKEAMSLCPNLYFVVISDKGYAHDTQKTVPFYRSFAKGGPFRGEQRQVLTTRNDGRVGFTFQPGAWNAY